MGEITIYDAYNLRPLDLANLADTTRWKYKRELVRYLETGAKLGDPAALADYAASLTQSRRAFLKAAVRLMTEGAINELKSGATPDNLDQVQAGLYRLEALQNAIHVHKPKGKTAHIWLTAAQVKAIMQTCGDDLQGRRDWIILGSLLGAGLRREELANLTFSNLRILPTQKGATRAALDITGKGDKRRTVPIQPLLADRLKAWQVETGGGYVARSLGRRLELADRISAVGIFRIVAKHGALIGIPDLAPHDMRRSYAMLAYLAGVPITQISVLLGHSSVKVTQNYLDLSLDLDTTASDFIPLG